ncbi:MAG TPA: MetQ/NlpA family ABC transporter substrate-binding protein [Enterococcus sp.]|nr:MetQ/NlpA family ABC transporter substrate-binding protein [Enterococcus sp.]HPR80393.1 MetQ/NlpA family ABC transporter substrate-binding protein [Enterococcus sp.]
MKKWLSGLLIASVLLLGACSNQEKAEETKELAKEETIRIASVGPDAEIWRFIAESDAAKEAGIKLEVQDITGGAITNNAVADGDADANAFQSIGYLESFNAESPVKLVPVATTYIEPMGIYSNKFKSVEEITDGATVALADNPSNTTRGLRVLESAGLIKLKDDFDDGIGTPDDVVENPKNLEFTLIDDLTGPRVLPDVDLVLISNTIAFEGGLNVLEDSIYREEADATTRKSINIIAVKEDRADEEALQKLGELYHDSKVQEFVAEKFDGTKVEVDEPVSDVWED